MWPRFERTVSNAFWALAGRPDGGRRGIWLVRLAVVAGLLSVAPLVLLVSANAESSGNGNLHLGKTVASGTFHPNLGLSLGVDKKTAIPGDTLNYKAKVSNTGATVTLQGDLSAGNTYATTATVASYWDYIATDPKPEQNCEPNQGHNTSQWTPFVGVTAAQPGYTPLVPSPTATGMTLALTPVPAAGVTYPTSGDPILGTKLQRGATAAWHYVATIPLSVAQDEFLGNPSRVAELRNTLHLEVTPRETNAQPAYTNACLAQSLFGRSPGNATNVKVTITPPTGSAVTFTAPSTPGLATLSPGASVEVGTSYKVPTVSAKGSTESDTEYLARLHALDGSNLIGKADATGTAADGSILTAPPASATTTEQLPVLSITKSGPVSAEPGTTATYSLSMTNSGGATASSLSAIDKLPEEATGTVTEVPSTLGPGAATDAKATVDIPGGASGPFTDTASLTWKDANGNAYGPTSSAFTTTTAGAPSGINPVSTTTVEGNFFPADPTATSFSAKRGDTPAFGQDFSTINFNPPNPSLGGGGIGGELPTGAINHNISGVSPLTRPFTDITTDLASNYSGTIVAQGNGKQAGVGDLAAFDAAFTATFVVTKAGDVTFNIVHDDGFLLGVGNGATRVSGAYENPPEPAQTAFKQYPLVGAFDKTTGGSPSTDHVTIHFPKPGIYPYELDYFESGEATQLSLTMTVGTVTQTSCNVCLYLGYADGLRASGSVFPFPWQGSPGVTFIGSGPFDSGALRFVNTTATPTTLEKVTVNVNGNNFDIWPRNMVIPAHEELILAQTTPYNLDTSDYSGEPCGVNGGVKPIITVVSGGQTSVFTDTNQILNTKDYDLACQGNESESWELAQGTGSPPAPECSAVEHTLWIGNDSHGDTFQTDLSGNVLADIKGVGTTGFAYAGSALFFGKANGEVQERTPDGNEVIRSFTLPPDSPSEDMAWDCKRHKIWRIGHDNKLREFDPTTGTEEKSVSLPTTDPTGEMTPLGGLGVAYDNKRDVLYVSFCQAGCSGLESGLVETVDPETGAVKGTLFRTTGFKTGGLAYQPDDDTLWVGSYGLIRHMTLGGEVLSSFARPEPGGFVDGLEFSPTPASRPPSAVNTPLPPADSLTLSPAEHTTRNVGQELTFTAALLDAKGHPVGKVPVSLTLRGANPQTLTAETDAAGVARFAPIVGRNSGEDQAQAVAFVEGRQSVSSTTPVTWNILKPGTEEAGGTAGQAAPAITGISPADGSKVTAPVPITAKIEPPAGQTITSWKVTRQALDPETPVVIASGSGAPPSPLATFDPTQLPNDTYAIAVSATDSGGGTQTAISTVAVEGDLKPGRYTTTFQDLNVPVNGFQMQVRRVYDSIDKRVGDFGVGWHVELSNFRVSANRELGAGGWAEYPKECIFGLCFWAFKTTAPHYVTVTYPDNHQEVFDFTPEGGAALLYWEGTAKFTPRPGTNTTGKLEPEGGTGIVNGFNGNIEGGGGIYNPTRFRLTEHDGTVLVLDVNEGLISETDRNGNSLSIDSAGVHASNGQSIIFTRDSQERIVKIEGPRGKPLTYTYSAAGDLTSSTDGDGNETTYAYDSNHDLLSSAGAGSKPLFTLHYDGSGRLDSITGADGNVTKISNDLAKQQQTVTDPLGRLTTVLSYDDRGDLVRRVEAPASGPTVTEAFAYDNLGRLTETTDALGRHTRTEYDGAGDPVALTDTSGRTTRFGYDSLGDLTSVKDNAGTELETVSYDASGNAKRISQPDGEFLEFHYDGSGHPVESTNARGDTSHYEYDAAGHLARITDPLDNSTKLTVNPDGSVNTVTDAKGGEYGFEYDGAGNITKVTDPLHHSWSRTYDGSGRLASLADPSGDEVALHYEPTGRVESETDANGVTTKYSYDQDGRLTDTATPSQSTKLTYDDLGRLASLTNEAATVAYSYDDAGQLTTETTTGAGGSGIPTASASYKYDGAGDLISRTGPEGTSRFGYDALGRLAAIADPAGREFSLQYDAMSRLIGMTRPGGVKDAISYDLTGQLATRTTKLGGAVIASYAASRDAAGHVVTITRPNGDEKIVHDSLGRVVEVSGPDRPTETYTYDAAGNRTSGPTSANGTLTYDESNRLVSDAKYTYGYDKDGRLQSRTDRTTGATTKYRWNDRGRLIEIARPDGGAQAFTYDPRERRIRVNASGSQSYYAYFDDSVAAELDASAKPTSKITSLPGFDQPLEIEAGGEPHYYVQDGQGNVVGLLNTEGAMQDSYSYGAFGQRVSESGATPNPFSFNAREYDSADNLYYFRARYYDPASGRFLSQDPAGHTNPYPIANNDPVDYVDPTGALFIEYTPLLPEQVKRGVALGKVNQCLGVALLRGLNGEASAAEALVSSAFGNLKDAVPYSGAFGSQGAQTGTAWNIGKQGASAYQSFAPPPPDRFVPQPVSGFDPDVWALARTPHGYQPKPFPGDAGGVEIRGGTLISPEPGVNVPKLGSELDTIYSGASDLSDYISKVANFQC